jgi:L-fuculose-phosphate aldolase
MDLYDEFAAERERVAYFMRRLYNKGLTTSSGGNISLRVGDNHVLLTPSALDKGELTADQVLLSTLAGENLSPHLKPTLETSMHLAVYRARADVRAVVHAHPVFATAFACVERPLDTALTSEIYMHVPRIGSAPFATPGSAELGRLVAESLADINVSLMRNHGVIAAAPTLYKAFDLLESIETFARVSFASSLIATPQQPVRPLSPSQLHAIDLLCGRE